MHTCPSENVLFHYIKSVNAESVQTPQKDSVLSFSAFTRKGLVTSVPLPACLTLTRLSLRQAEYGAVLWRAYKMFSKALCFEDLVSNAKLRSGALGKRLGRECPDLIHRSSYA